MMRKDRDERGGGRGAEGRKVFRADDGGEEKEVVSR